MINVLFICHGNICRSPMGEFILKDMVEKAGLSDCFHIESAATSTEECWNGVGNPVYPPARKKLAEHGISCGGKRAVQIKKSDYARFDYILCAEQQNIRNLKWIIGSDPEHKVKRLLDYSAHPRDISDPWYTGDFDRAYDDVYEGCAAFLDDLQKNHRIPNFL